MILRYSATSPYARKVRAVALLKGVHDRIALVLVDTWSPPSDLFAENPLGKVPCLSRDDGFILYDSPVICEYLDTLAPQHPLFPIDGDKRWRALRLQALGDGIMDAAVENFVERSRPSDKIMEAWLERLNSAIWRTVNCLAMDKSALDELTIGSVSVACALGYLDLRIPHCPWRQASPALTDWFNAIDQQWWMQSTKPPLG